ncbi:hypothetical protein ACLOJK_041034 [Asimina triloba]
MPMLPLRARRPAPPHHGGSSRPPDRICCRAPDPSSRLRPLAIALRPADHLATAFCRTARVRKGGDAARSASPDFPISSSRWVFGAAMAAPPFMGVMDAAATRRLAVVCPPALAAAAD